LSLVADKFYADVSFVAWRWLPVDPKLNDGVPRIPIFESISLEPTRLHLTPFVAAGVNLRDLGLKHADEALRFLFRNPVVAFPQSRLDVPDLRKMPPSQQAKAKAKFAEANQTLKTWRGGA
jgi:hypothetical protein